MEERYSKPEMAPVDFLVESALLKGSVTTTSLTVSQVEVEEYENGFASQGGFQQLDFD